MLGNLGSALVQLEQYSKAMEHFQESLQIFKTIGNRSAEAQTLENLAELYQKLGCYDLALEYCNQALVIATELDIPVAKECHELKEKLLTE